MKAMFFEILTVLGVIADASNYDFWTDIADEHSSG